MLRRLCFLMLGLAALTAAAALYAGEPRQTKKDKGLTDKELREIAAKEKVLQERYRKFEEALQALHDRLAGGSAADKERAAKLKAALDRSVDGSVSERFSKFVKFLASNKLKDADFGKLVDQSAEIARDLQEVLDLLEGAGKKLVNRRDERLSLEEKIRQLDKLIREQNVIKGQVEIGLDPKQVKENQGEVTQNTKNFAKKLANEDKKGDKGDKSNTGGEAKNDKSQSKESKNGNGKEGEAKDSGKENKGAESKPGDAKNQGDKKDGKPGQSKEGGKDNKSGQSGKESKPGQSKDGKGSESKSGQSKDGKGSESKSGQSKESKDGKGKEGEAKDAGDKKDGDQPKSSLKTKQDEKKAGGDDGQKKEGSAKQGQQGDNKAGSPKQGQQGGAKKDQQSQSKSGDSQASKSSQGQSKSGQQSQGQGQSKSGQDKDDQGSSKKESPKADQPPSQQDPRQHVDQAIQKQKKVEKDLDRGDKKDVIDGTKKVVDDLKLAKQKLEELLRQLREEEQKQLLETLITRCKQMKAMQEAVKKETEASARSIDSHNDKKPDRGDILDLLKQSDDEKKIVNEATKAIELLEAEGSAVAFPEVFQQVREDMKSVARKLATVDPRKDASVIEKDMKVTIAIEQDIIDTLDEMIKALTKELKDKEKKPSPPKDGQPPPQADPKLLNKIQELKMIRAMQVRVNARTTLYGRTYEGEQADVPAIRRDLADLAGRQDRIFEVTRNIIKGD
jgi:hypothetical protein